MNTLLFSSNFLDKSCFHCLSGKTLKLANVPSFTPWNCWLASLIKKKGCEWCSCRQLWRKLGNCAKNLLKKIIEARHSLFSDSFHNKPSHRQGKCYLFIASYYRQLPVDKLIPVLLTRDFGPLGKTKMVLFLWFLSYY